MKEKRTIDRRELVKKLALGGTGFFAAGQLKGADLSASQQPFQEDFVDLLLRRRSKRFTRGINTKSGPLKFESKKKVLPLTEEEEAFLCFCAAGITGAALGDLVYDREFDGQVMAGMMGRTIPSPDAACTNLLIVTNDRETYALKRPHDLSLSELKHVIGLAKEKRFLEIQKIMKVTLKNERALTPLNAPYNIPANKWSLFKPGTSYFLPVVDYSYLLINNLLTTFETHSQAYVVDERKRFRSAGLKNFGRCSNGGHLMDCFEDMRTFTIEQVDMLIQRLYNVEMGAMIQNLSLGANYLNLGGFPNFAGHDMAWFEAIGFRMETMKASQYMGLGTFLSALQKIMGKDIDVPYAVGLEKNGKTLLKSYAPPYYPSMDDAVEAVLEHKFSAKGVYGDRLKVSAFKNPQAISKAAHASRPSQKAVMATKSYCQYIFDTYGRFPAHMPAFLTTIGFQAGHLDQDFYSEYYRES